MKLKNHITFVINRKVYKDIQHNRINTFILQYSDYWAARLLYHKVAIGWMYPGGSYYSTQDSGLELHPITSITFKNGIRWNSPSFKIECKNIIFDAELNQFIFELGKIL